MANYENGTFDSAGKRGNNNNQGRFRSTGEKIREGHRKLNLLIEDERRHCVHKDRVRTFTVKVNDTDMYVANRNSLPDDAVICTQCTETFSAQAYDKNTLYNCVFALKSMLNQVKVMVDLEDDDLEDIVGVLEYLDKPVMKAIAFYEQAIIKKLSDGKNKNRNNNNYNSNNKGRIGVSAGQFGRL